MKYYMILDTNDHGVTKTELFTLNAVSLEAANNKVFRATHDIYDQEKRISVTAQVSAPVIDIQWDKHHVTIHKGKITKGEFFEYKSK